MGGIVSRTLAAVVVTTLGATASAQVGQPCIVVHLRSSSVVPGDAVLDGETRVSRTFKAIGVSIHWDNDGAPLQRFDCSEVNVAVLSMSETASFFANSSARDDILGITMSQANRAYLFGQRIHEIAVSSNLALPIVFGRVLAHELGHLVLSDGHSKTGIMRAGLSYQPPPLDPGFIPSQGESIRARLKSRRILDLAGNGQSGFSALETN